MITKKDKKDRDKTIGLKIREQRKRLRMTQSQLAKKVGIHEKQLSRVETGHNFPTLENFFKILEVLDLKLSDFDELNTYSKIRDDIIAILKKMSDKELKIYLDIITVVKKNIKT